MHRRKLHGLIATGIMAPIVVLAGRASWLEVLVALGVAAAYLAILVLLDWKAGGVNVPDVWSTWGVAGRGLAAVALIGNVMLMAYGATMSLRAFPMEGAFPLYPVTLLLMGVWLAAKGPTAVGRFGGVLWVFLVAPLGIVLVFGAMGLKAVEVVPTIYIDSSAPLIGLALVSGSGLWLARKGKGTPWPWLLGLGLIALAVSLVTMGDLGLLQARQAKEPFYLMTQSISLFGVMERFEVLVAAVLLLGFGVLSSYLAMLGCEMAKVAIGKPCPVAQCVMALFVLFVLPLLSPLFLLGTITICWVVLPVITLGLVARKKHQRNCE